MEILHPKKMMLCDQKTLKERDITSLELMEQAGKAIYEAMQKEAFFCHANQRLIVCGTGNNGGDGLVIAEQLLQRGQSCDILMIGDQNRLSLETKSVLMRLKTTVLWNCDAFDFNQYDVIVDALFGIGLDRPLDSMMCGVIESINASEVPVLSVDIPSGINAETGLASPVAIKAFKTYIVQFYKFGNLLNQAKDYHGQSVLVEAGIKRYDYPADAYLMKAHDYYHTLPKRKHYSHKYHYGSVLVYGHQAAMLGAPLLSAQAALRAGTGLVHVALSDRDRQLIYPYDLILDTINRPADWKAILTPINTVVFGPGVGKSDAHKEHFQTLLKTDVPMVIDADGLYHLARSMDCLRKTKTLVMTPHQGEFERFMQIDKGTMYQDLFKHLRLFDEYPITWVLKGPTTIIYSQGRAVFSDLGSAALATAGSGDVLSGLIGSFLARGFEPFNAAQYGVLVHSLAAKETLPQFGEESLIASDLIQAIPQIMQLLKSPQ